MASSGLLVLRPCGEPAIGACSSCGKALCMMHMAGGTCPECAVAGGNWEDNDAAREAANRNNYYDTYGSGGEYGAANYFTQGDRRVSGLGPAGIGAPDTDDDYDPFDT